MREEGWLLRVYAKHYKDVKGRVERVAKMVDVIRKVSKGPIVVLIPWDKDCGETAVTLDHAGLDIIVERPKGSPNTDVLNYGLDVLNAHGCERAIVVSNKAAGAVTPVVMTCVREAFDKGALAVGVAFDEFAPVVCLGNLLNTFAVYDLAAARACGKFCYEHSGDKGGVEETSLLLAMTQVYGQCLAVIETEAAVDLFASQESQQRHRDLQDDKLARIEDLVRDAVGASFDWLQQYIMAGYPVRV